MSFKDLTTRAAAAMKPKPAETAKNPEQTEVSEAVSKEPALKSKTD